MSDASSVAPSRTSFVPVEGRRKQGSAAPDQRLCPDVASETLPGRADAERLGLALKLFLEVLIALRCALCGLTTHDGRHKQLADPMSLEVHRDRDPRPGVVGERFDGYLDVWPDRSVYTVCDPVGGGPTSVISCVIARSPRPIR